MSAAFLASSKLGNIPNKVEPLPVISANSAPKLYKPCFNSLISGYFLNTISSKSLLIIPFNFEKLLIPFSIIV